MSETQVSGTPRHLWIVAILALVWNLIGGLDYVMTQTKNEAYMAQFTPEQLDFFYGFPAWLVAVWATAVWGGVLASVLLLMRKKLAVRIFVISLLCMLVTAVHNFGFADGASIVGAEGMFFTLLIFVVALGLVIYSRRMAAKGVLA